jgi:nucleotide-binding universal stress UspA family protein
MRAADKLLSMVEHRRAQGNGRSPSTPPVSRARFTSILCPIDFSEHSRLALQYAEALADRAHARLVVIYANDPLLVAAAAVALHDRRLAQRSAKELRSFVDSALAGAPATRRRCKTFVSVGDSAEEILSAAARHKSGLIVLGTQGLTGANRLVMGSTTLSVLQKTTVPVLAVPCSGEDLALPSASWPGARIAVALDLEGRDSAAEVDVAARVARWLGSSLLLLHVVAEIDAPDWMGGDLSAHQRILVAKAQQQVDTLTAGARRSVEADGLVVCGRIADEIAALAARERIGLLITTLRDRRGWFGAQRGSVSYHVLSHAVSPVLALPPGRGKNSILGA